MDPEKGEDESHPQRTLRGLRNRPATLTRFDENTREQAELEAQLNRSQEMKSKRSKEQRAKPGEVSGSSAPNPGR